MPMNDNQQKLVDENVGLVRFLIGKYYPTFSHDEDVYQSGMIGLCKAADASDSIKTKFSAYAARCILNEINNEFTRRKKYNNEVSLDTIMYNDFQEDSE